MQSLGLLKTSFLEIKKYSGFNLIKNFTFDLCFSKIGIQVTGVGLQNESVEQLVKVHVLREQLIDTRIIEVYGERLPRNRVFIMYCFRYPFNKLGSDCPTDLVGFRFYGCVRNEYHV
jgi:hypothetical protein